MLIDFTRVVNQILGEPLVRQGGDKELVEHLDDVFRFAAHQDTQVRSP